LKRLGNSSEPLNEKIKEGKENQLYKREQMRFKGSILTRATDEHFGLPVR